MKRGLPLLLGLFLMCASIIPGTAAAAPADCGKTTLEGTIELKADGTLKCGPGQHVTVREEIASALVSRVSSRTALKTIFAFSDFQLADEESPLRAEWLDKCEEHPANAAFRPHETMVAHLLNAHLRQANRIAQQGGPIMHRPFDFAFALGDLADNQQYNETRWFIDLLDGGKLVNPDSGSTAMPAVDVTDQFPGGDDYDGVEKTPPPSGTPPIEFPQGVELGLQLKTLQNLANEPFWASGLRRADGSLLPWYTLAGNHDVKVQGSVPDDDTGWRTFARNWATGAFKIIEPFDTNTQAAACEGGFSQDSLTSLFSNPLLASPVPPDTNRRLLDKDQWINEHSNTTGIPAGHGWPSDESHRCPKGPPPTLIAAEDPSGEKFRRICYEWVEDPFQFIVLDTNPLEGAENGNIDEDQFNWLEDKLKASSQSYYDASGVLQTNSAATNRLIVVAGHHPISSTDNPGYLCTGVDQCMEAPAPPEVHRGDELEELLLRFPNVILLVDGHSHRNRITPHTSEKGHGFWEVNTAAVADHPTMSRTLEIVNNRDGTLSIFSVVFDALGAVNVRQLDWSADPTDEVALGGAQRHINEEWLASAGREVLFNDPQQDLSASTGGNPEDRNVELLVGAPFQLTDGGTGGACNKPGNGPGAGKNPHGCPPGHAKTAAPAGSTEGGPVGIVQASARVVGDNWVLVLLVLLTLAAATAAVFRFRFPRPR